MVLLRGPDVESVSVNARAVVFDLFGTLVPKWDSARSMVVLVRMARSLGLATDEFVEAWAQTYGKRELGRMTVRQSLGYVAESAGATTAEGLMEDLDRMWAALLAWNVRPRNAAVVQTLREIQARGFKVGLISNCGPEVPVLVRKFELAPLIDHATFSCEIGIAKPDAEIFEAHCRDLGVRPEQSVFIGDGGSYELDGARRIGMESVLLRIETEIAAEGLPEGVDSWTGAEIGCIEDVLGRLDGPWS